MTKTFAFDIAQRIIIKEIQTPGTVRRISIDKAGITYLVTYWLDSKMEEEWLYEWELTKEETYERQAATGS